MSLFEIKSRFTGSVLFSLETDSLKLCVEAAVKARANLAGANLADANLAGANLADANLAGANLEGAYGEKLKTVGRSPLITIGPIGSRNSLLYAWHTDAGIYVHTGCFWNTLEKFKVAVEKEHGENKHGIHYRAAIALIESRFTKSEAA